MGSIILKEQHIIDSDTRSFSIDHLSGILIDSFCYNAIGGWHFTRDNIVCKSQNESMIKAG